LNQVGIPLISREKPKPGEIQRHEEIIASKSENSENSQAFLSTPQLFTKRNRADISEAQPCNYNKALNFNINSNSVKCLHSDKKIITDQESFGKNNILESNLIRETNMNNYKDDLEHSIERKNPNQQKENSVTEPNLLLKSNSPKPEVIETNPQAILQSQLSKSIKEASDDDYEYYYSDDSSVSSDSEDADNIPFDIRYFKLDEEEEVNYIFPTDHDLKSQDKIKMECPPTSFVKSAHPQLIIINSQNHQMTLLIHRTWMK
jgi:hypothetical protein